jgi:pimeloyl-ACP methyl ester carboxylesterase
VTASRSLFRLTVAGAELAVQVRGDGIPPVLFIHGFPFDHTLWRHQMAALSRWHRIAPDLRGAGISSVPGSPEAYSVGQYAADLLALLDSLDISEVVVCGQSMGGYIIFELLRRAPTRIRAAILCSTKAVPDSAEAKRDRDVMAGVAQRDGARAVAEKLVPRLLSRATLEHQPQVVKEVREMIERTPASGIVGALRALRDRPDSTPSLGQIRVPVLVVAGDDDQIAPAAGMQEMARAIPGARFALITGAGHVAPLEQPVPLSGALGDFLVKLS